MIDSFRGKYFFLSNFYEAPITYEGLTFSNNEAAFQAMKCPQSADKFLKLTASEAKKLGRHVYLRSDWDAVKEEYMYEICLAKFIQNKDLVKMLMDTGTECLEEGNTWGDREWGTVNHFGNNKLGKILMKVREELRKNQYGESHILE